ncbi:histidine ammonia-lyase [Brachybacterium huguangmaarense]|uniref:Histidine ammonia-lyase n=1 Tax=Brachybacterium huguangmaarense TaxID=1652028 RepID=A0ABY6G3D9_9MICO|nr:histidine ammonia-lyase [Brachybacterium huguangmaarense]UYG17721.1 histidine ammonia-lyase [Brachybacterium huguangmaarense]
MTRTLTLSTSGLRADDVLAVARHDARVELADDAREEVQRVRAHVDALAQGSTPVYGVSTGFGALADTAIEPSLRQELQRSLIRSHAAGTGPEVEREVVRALMLLRAKTLASGHTGVRPVVIDTMLAVLNAGITPIVHEYGSLGCSGDLAPLAHCAIVLIGEGRARDREGAERPVPELLAEAGIEPITLQEKEGLALINGTDGMLGQLLMAIADLEELVRIADLTTALSVQALRGRDSVFRAELHEDLRPHPGQTASAANILALLEGSEILADAAGEGSRVQDAYSLRCAPQVAGGVRDTLTHARTVAERELAAAIDNPVVLSDGQITSNGNFHGAPVAYVLDFLAIVAADLASMSERRSDRLLDRSRSFGLPPFLADDPGVDSGFMIAQYTQAALVSTMKRLAAPASVDSIPSSAMQEDHVSMGWHAARKLRTAIDALRSVLAIELLTAARGVDLRAPLRPSAASAAAIAALREHVAGPGRDRFLAPDIDRAEELLRDGSVLRAVQEVVGALR